jgi:hypothetical protein
LGSAYAAISLGDDEIAVAIGENRNEFERIDAPLSYMTS